MFPFRHLSAFIALALLLSIPLNAGTAGDDDHEITIIVTAERTPQPATESVSTVTVVTAGEIKSRGASSVADVLRFVPGIAVRHHGQPGTTSTALIRGVKSSQSLVLLDGQRISSSAFITGADLSKFPLTNVSRIEVIRGPASSLYGSEAIGGVINIITRTPSDSGGEAVLGFGGHGRIERTLAFEGGTDQLAWQFTGSTPAYTGFRPNSDYSATNLSTRIVIPSVSGWELSMRAERHNDDLGLPGADPDRVGIANLDDRMKWKRENYDFTARRDAGPGQLELRAYRLAQELHNISPGEFWTVDSTIAGTTEAMEAIYRFGAGAHNLVLGAEYRGESYNNVERGTSPSTQNERINDRALYVQNRWSANPATDVILGARFDDHSTAGGKLTPRLGISRSLNSSTRLRASYSEGFRAPNFVELYYPVGPWGPGFSGNPALKPETSRQYEVGLSYHKGNDSVDFAVFDNNVTNLIHATFATPYENIGRSTQKGMELTWGRRLAGGTRLSASYSYTDAKNRETGERLNGIPRSQLGMTVAGRVRSIETALTGRWTDGRPDLAFDPVTYESRNVKLPGRVIFDLTLSYPGLKYGDPYLIIRNLTNTAYEEIAGYRAEGRTVEIGMRSRW